MVAAIGDPKAHSEADCAFHTAIFVATHNVMLARMIDLIAIGIFANVVKAPKTVVEGQRQSLPYHADVLAAIKSRNPREAAAAADRLLDSWHPVPDRVRLMKRRGEPTSSGGAVPRRSHVHH
jgi:GntR family transcriptional regulator, galactonate operon transcriptional repressor